MPRDEFQKRITKKTKAKHNSDLKGKYSSKAVRKYEATMGAPRIII
jgi:hypothetical protein